MPNVGPLEIAVVLVIVLIIFGPKRLPELGQSMGRGHPRVQELALRGQGQGFPEEQRRELQSSQAAADAAESKPAEPVEGEVVTENKA